MPGCDRGERRARCSISSRSPATLPSGSAPSGASSASGTGLSGPRPYTMALVTRTTRPTRAGRRRGQHGLRAAHVERAPGPVLGVRRHVHVGVHHHVHAGSRPARAGSRTSTSRQVTPTTSPRWSSMAITRPSRRRRGQPHRQRVAEPAGRAGDRDDRAAPGGLGPPGGRPAQPGGPRSPGGRYRGWLARADRAARRGGAAPRSSRARRRYQPGYRGRYAVRARALRRTWACAGCSPCAAPGIT